MSESVLYKTLFVDSHHVRANFLTRSTLAVCVIHRTDNYTCILIIIYSGIKLFYSLKRLVIETTLTCSVQ